MADARMYTYSPRVFSLKDSSALSCDGLVDTLLESAGVLTPEEKSKFLTATYDDISDPLTMHGMSEAVMRTRTAIERGELIAIYGDYDADGICSTAILADVFKYIEYPITTYLPHRHSEGYGFHIPAIDILHARGVKLIITVDVGIVAHNEVAYANSLGIDVIITDHHTPHETLPSAYAVVHPKLGTYADPMICGAGVAFQLARALCNSFRNEVMTEIQKVPPEGWEKWLLDLVGIATVSDMVPLFHENRIFVRYGLMVLRKMRRPGLTALLRQAGCAHDQIAEDDIAFSITPRINAASRMDHPELAFELLTAPDGVRAQELAKTLGGKNDDRKTEVARIMRQVHTRMETRSWGDVIVIGDPDWNAGVVGLVATKICEEYKVSSFVWSDGGGEDGVLRGSCRAYGAIDVHGLMQAAPANTFIQFGGHAGAGGFSVPRTTIHEVEGHLQNAYTQIYSEVEQESISQIIDIDISSGALSEKVFSVLRELAPFGFGFSRPLCAFHTEVISSKSFGTGNAHLEYTFTNGTKPFRAIAFYANPDEYTYSPKMGEKCICIGVLEESFFRGKREQRLRIIDLLPVNYFSTDI